MKRPDRLLAKKRFIAVVQISEKLHEKLMEKSDEDIEEFGVIGVKDSKVKENYQLKILTINYFQIYLKAKTNNINKPYEFYDVDFEGSRSTYGIFTPGKNSKIIEDPENPENQTLKHKFIEFSNIKVNIFLFFLNGI